MKDYDDELAEVEVFEAAAINMEAIVAGPHHHPWIFHCAVCGGARLVREAATCRREAYEASRA